MGSSFQKHERFEAESAHLRTLDRTVGALRNPEIVGDLVLRQSSILTSLQQD